jgi:uncharacterized membrane protein HdeD (DUF308 family)
MNTIVKTKNSNWWVSLLKGVLLIIFGVWLFESPNENLIKLSFAFGVLILVGGLLEVGLAFKSRNTNEYWNRALTSGILDILLGVLLMANPSFILFLITLIISIWLIFRGMLSIYYALILKKGQNKNWFWGFIFGILLILFGGIFVWHPGFIGFTLGIWAALAFISLGILRIVLAFKKPEIIIR